MATRDDDAAAEAAPGLLFKGSANEIALAESRMALEFGGPDLAAVRETAAGTPVFLLDTERAELSVGYETVSPVRANSIDATSQLRIRRAGRVRSLPWCSAACIVEAELDAASLQPNHRGSDGAPTLLILSTSATQQLLALRPGLQRHTSADAGSWSAESELEDSSLSGSARDVLSSDGSDSGSPAKRPRPQLSMVALAADDAGPSSAADTPSLALEALPARGTSNSSGKVRSRRASLQARAPAPVQTAFVADPGPQMPLRQRAHALNAIVDQFLDNVGRCMNVRHHALAGHARRREYDLSNYSGNGANLVWGRVQEVVGNIYGSAAVQVYGSFATGLWLPGQSDLDLLVSFQRFAYPRVPLPEQHPEQQQQQEQQSSQAGGQMTSQQQQQQEDANPQAAAWGGSSDLQQQQQHASSSAPPMLSPRVVDVVNIDRKQILVYLCALHAALKMQPWCRSIKLIKNTSMPVIKLVAASPQPFPAGPFSALHPNLAGAGGDIPVDISFRTSDHHGLEARDYVLQLTEDLPGVLRPLVLVLKRLLRGMGLHDVYTGGLGSYSLTALVIFFLLRVGFLQPDAALARDRATSEGEGVAAAAAARPADDVASVATAEPSAPSSSAASAAAAAGAAGPVSAATAARSRGSRHQLSHVAAPDNVPPLVAPEDAEDEALRAAAAAVDAAAQDAREWLRAYVKGKAPDGVDVGVLLLGFLRMLSPPAAGGMDLEAAEISLEGRGRLLPRRPRRGSSGSTGSAATAASGGSSDGGPATLVGGGSSAETPTTEGEASLRAPSPPPAKLCIRDPIKHAHRLGAGSFKMYLVQQRFMELRQQLEEDPAALAPLLAMPDPAAAATGAPPGVGFPGMPMHMPPPPMGMPYGMPYPPPVAMSHLGAPMPQHQQHLGGAYMMPSFPPQMAMPPPHVFMQQQQQQQQHLQHLARLHMQQLQQHVQLQPQMVVGATQDMHRPPHRHAMPHEAHRRHPSQGSRDLPMVSSLSLDGDAASDGDMTASSVPPPSTASVVSASTSSSSTQTRSNTTLGSSPRARSTQTAPGALLSPPRAARRTASHGTRDVRSLPATPKRAHAGGSDRARNFGGGGGGGGAAALEQIQVPVDGCTVVARNIPYEVTAEDLGQLTRMFATHGPVLAVSSSLTRGSLYVTFAQEADALRAMDAMQMYPVRDRQLKIRSLDDLLHEKLLPPPVTVPAARR